MEWRRGELVVSTDRGRIDESAALALLHTTFWATGMEPSVLARAIANSISFGVYDGEVLVGFGRVVTDLATDVVIADSSRGKGLGRWLPSACWLTPTFRVCAGWRSSPVTQKRCMPESASASVPGH